MGGGRIVGEVCHFVDLAAYLTGAVPVKVHARGTPDGGRSAVVDDFREMRLLGGGKHVSQRARLSQDKGHRGEWEVLRGVLTQGGAPPIETASWVATSLATLAAVRSLRSGVDGAGFVAGARGGA